MDFAISANLVFYMEKNYLLLKLSPPTVFTVELSNFNQSFFMVSSYRLVLYMQMFKQMDNIWFLYRCMHLHVPVNDENAFASTLEAKVIATN